jgi:hypothetical protein
MAFSELRSRQSWSKIGVLGTDNGEGFFGPLWLQTSIAGSVPELGDETPWTLQFVAIDESPDLTDRQPESLGDRLLFSLSISP